MSLTFELDGRWKLHPRVGLRPESFGALAYHFGTRRLSFIKSPLLLAVLEHLETSASAREACRRAGVADAQLGPLEKALGTLAQTEMLVREPLP